MNDMEKDALERRIDELCAELHRTQCNLDMWVIRANITLKNLTATRAANFMLCELVRNMWLDLDVPKLDSEEYKRRMCELGIEVPE